MVDQSEIDDIVRHFEDLEDPRSEVNLQHPLISVVVISLMAVLAGAAGPTAIARWAQLKADELLNVLPLPNGIPRKDVFRRVLLRSSRKPFKPVSRIGWRRCVPVRRRRRASTNRFWRWMERRCGGAMIDAKDWARCTRSPFGRRSSA